MLHTHSNNSDLANDYACTFCVRDQGSYSSASNYCPDCDVYYCRPCIQYICDHGAIGKVKQERWGKPTNRTSGEPCTKHADNMIQLYCGKHDEVGCHICMAERHRPCTSLVYITELVSKQSSKQIMYSKKEEIMEIKSKLSWPSTCKGKAAKKTTLDTTSGDLRAAVRRFRREIGKLPHELERQTLTELEDLKSGLNNQIDDNAQTCDRLGSDIDSLLKKLEQRNIDDTLRFIWLNQSSVLEEGRKAVSEIVDVTNSLSFDYHTEIETYLRSLNGLGDFKIKKDQVTQTKACFTTEQRKTTETSLRNIDSHRKLNRKDQVMRTPDVSMLPENEVESRLQSFEQILYRKDHATTKQRETSLAEQETDTINIRHSKDKETPEICGMCQLSDGSFVLADITNHCLKQLKLSNKQQQKRHQLRNQPRCVCSVNDQEVAVALNNTMVQFVYVGTSMKTTTMIQLKQRCSGLAYSNDKLYVTGELPSIQVYNRKGVIEDEFRLDKQLSVTKGSGASAKNISVSPDGKILYVTHLLKNRLLTIDDNGRVINSYKPEGVDYMWGVCVDATGDVLVSGADSRNIIQVTSTGHTKKADILAPSFGNKKPWALCFDRFKGRLLVSCKSGNTVFVLDPPQIRQ